MDILGDKAWSTVIERFWKHVVIPEDDEECWIWQSSISNSYGWMYLYEGKFTYAHRISWTIHFGSIPENYTIDHICEVKRTVEQRWSLRKKKSPWWGLTYPNPGV